MEKNFRFDVGTKYDFNIYPTLPGYSPYMRNMRVSALMTYERAVKEIDIHALTAAAYSYLPEGTSKNPVDYLYVEFVSLQGVTTILPMEWINIDTVQVSESDGGFLYLKVRGKREEINHIRAVLESNNYVVESISDKP